MGAVSDYMESLCAELCTDIETLTGEKAIFDDLTSEDQAKGNIAIRFSYSHYVALGNKFIFDLAISKPVMNDKAVFDFMELEKSVIDNLPFEGEVYSSEERYLPLANASYICDLNDDDGSNYGGYLKAYRMAVTVHE